MSISINDYQGVVCGRVWEDVNSTASVLNCKCRGKGCKMEWLPRSARSRARGATLTYVYFEDAKGNIEVAGRSSDKAPKGFQKKEAVGFAEMRALESRMTQKERDKRKVWAEREQYLFETQQKIERDDLRQKMTQGFYAPRYDDRGKVIAPEFVRPTQAGRDFMRQAMSENDKKERIYEKRVEPNVYIDILHNDERKSRRS